MSKHHSITQSIDCSVWWKTKSTAGASGNDYVRFMFLLDMLKSKDGMGEVDLV